MLNKMYRDKTNFEGYTRMAKRQSYSWTRGQRKFDTVSEDRMIVAPAVVRNMAEHQIVHQLQINSRNM